MSTKLGPCRPQTWCNRNFNTQDNRENIYLRPHVYSYVFHGTTVNKIWLIFTFFSNSQQVCWVLIKSFTIKKNSRMCSSMPVVINQDDRSADDKYVYAVKLVVCAPAAMSSLAQLGEVIRNPLEITPPRGWQLAPGLGYFFHLTNIYMTWWPLLYLSRFHHVINQSIKRFQAGYASGPFY